MGVAQLADCYTHTHTHTHTEKSILYRKFKLNWIYPCILSGNSTYRGIIRNVKTGQQVYTNIILFNRYELKGKYEK
jgi:hypothetical protein